MPIFDYTCSKCKTTGEYLTKTSDTDPGPCKHCQAAEQQSNKTSIITEDALWLGI